MALSRSGVRAPYPPLDWGKFSSAYRRLAFGQPGVFSFAKRFLSFLASDSSQNLYFYPNTIRRVPWNTCIGMRIPASAY